jgi:glycosyltransferase involved in cell wall biosynthesis
MHDKASILFHRYFQGFTGGHMKVKDYMSHIDTSNWIRSRVFVDSSSNPNHLWQGHPGLVQSYNPVDADILFIAGIDWRALKPFPNIENQKIIINFIQHVRHADPTKELFRYLSHKAIRICVSQEVADAIGSTGLCNGPIYTIPNGIDFAILPKSRRPPDYDVAIAGLKCPQLARELSQRLSLRRLSVDCLIEQIPRNQYLERISRCNVVVTLPAPTEGFYLPALEAMAMGVALVCPDCVGNRSFCHDGITCLIPHSDPASIEESVIRLLRDNELADRLRSNAAQQCLYHDIYRERNAFLQLLYDTMTISGMTPGVSY